MNIAIVEDEDVFVGELKQYANGTVWSFVIEENYDFILEGSKTDSNGDKLVKRVVGPTFSPSFGEQGTVTLGVAAATLLVNGVEDTARTEVLNVGYSAFTAKWCEEKDAAMCHIPIGINNVTHTIYSTEADFEDVLPGWGV